MSNIKLISLENSDQVAQEAAELWLTESRLREAAVRVYAVALSGGRIAKSFFKELARSIKAQEIVWSRVHFFWADERCVPPDSMDSNFRIAKESLLDPLGIKEANIHRIRGEAEPALAAHAAGRELQQTIGSSGNDIPILDRVFLGMGEDGHIASLFPEALEPNESGDLYLPVTASKPPPQRITMSYQVIRTAREVLVLASGPGKQEALVESLHSNGQTPLAKILQTREQTTILTDIALPRASP